MASNKVSEKSIKENENEQMLTCNTVCPCTADIKLSDLMDTGDDRESPVKSKCGGSDGKNQPPRQKQKKKCWGKVKSGGGGGPVKPYSRPSEPSETMEANKKAAQPVNVSYGKVCGIYYSNRVHFEVVLL